jgi:virginiamycin B lyase
VAKRFGVATSLYAIAFLIACSNGSMPNSGSTASKVAPSSRGPARIRVFDELPKHPPYYFPVALTGGPDSAIWVCDDIDQDAGPSAIARIIPSGRRTNTFRYQNYASPSCTDIVTGPDGALWFTDQGDYRIVRMTTGGAMQFFSTGYSSYLLGIASGPDKALWFTDDAFATTAIGRITTKGKITLYTAGISVHAGIVDITAGPDGALWFTENAIAKIARITVRGKVTEYSIGGSSDARPYSIAPGPDGALWFTEQAGRIGRITTSGSVTEYSAGITPQEVPVDIAPGLDGAMWFTEYETYGSYRTRASKIGRIAMSGHIDEYSKIDPSSEPTGIVQGPDGRMWFVETHANRVGRVTP